MSITLPTLPNPEGQAKLILQSNAMGLITPKFFTLDEKELAAQDSLGVQGENTPDMTSWMGTPVFDTLQIDQLSYTDNSGVTISIPKMVIATVMHTVNITKNIVKTPIAGGNGTVKEFIGLSDYQITFNGMIVGRHMNIPPTLEMRQLISFCEAPVALSVFSNFLSQFKISSIVIDGEPSFSQIEGTRNAVSFTINAVSDTPFEVEYNNNNVKTPPVITSVPSFR